MLDFTGKVVFIAGAGCVGEGFGNGRATAVLLARQGAKVFGTDYNPGSLIGTSNVMLEEGHSNWTPWIADMTSGVEVKKAVEQCLTVYGRIDVLVNNVGGSLPGTPVSLTEDEWQGQMDHNLKTAYLGCKYVLPVMEHQFEIEGVGGAIVNVSSTASKNFQVGGRVHVAYAASKAGLEGFSRATAIAYAHKEIRVNTVVVGMMNTPLIAHRLVKQLGSASVEELNIQRSALVPLRRMGESWDIANAVAFLASEEARFITATEIIVDGGVTATRLSPAPANAH